MSVRMHLAGFLAAVSLAGGASLAQTGPTAPPATAPPQTGRPLGEVLVRVSQGAGVTVVAESSLQNAAVAPLRIATTPQNLEAQLNDLIKSLPPGTRAIKLYVPPTPTGRAWTGDDAAEYAAMQAKISGTTAAPPPGMVEIIGQRLPAEQSQDIITRLRLRPVYLIARGASLAGARFPGMNPDWGRMSPEQREAFAQQQAQNLINGDPQVMGQYWMQQAMVFRSMLQQMPPEQRQMIFQGMGQMLREMNREGLGPRPNP